MGLNGARTEADRAGQFSITVRDLANNPIASSNVKIDFSGCADINLGDQACQMGGPGVSAMTADCANRNH